MKNPVLLKEKIGETIRLAGAKALELNSKFLTGKATFDYKDDTTFVTDADLEIEDFLRESISKVVGGIGSIPAVFGEERGWTGPPLEEAKHKVIIDPIEGTAFFISPLKLPLWGISVSFFQDSHLAMSWFHLPAIEAMIFAESGVGATLNGMKLKIDSQPITAASYLGVSSDAHRWGLSAYPGKIRAYGSTGFNVICAVVGTLNAVLLTRFHNYDLAALALIAKEAGAELVYYPSGHRVEFSDLLRVYERRPILICHPDQVDDFVGMNFHQLKGNGGAKNG